jgi:hypothetical protein
MVVAERQTQAQAQAHAGARDFDFLWGHWRIEHLRLSSRLTGSTHWERFGATMQCWPILGGTGNVDNMRATWHGQEFEGASLRLFDPATGKWSIYWADTNGHQLLPPVVGAFEDGVGEFVGDDQHEGQLVRVRFRWSEITTDAARWEQAFSIDRGENWETNWIMLFSRLAGHEAQEAR